MLDDIADQLIGIHSVRQLTDDEIAGRRDFDTVQVGRRRCKDFQSDEMSERYQFADLRTFNHRIEGIAEPASITAAWRCGQSDNDRIRVGIDNALICSRANMVRLIDKDDLCRRQVHRLCSHSTSMQGLNPGDLNQCLWPQVFVASALDDAGAESEALQFVARLRQQLIPMRDEHSPLESGRRTLDDFGSDDRLSGTRGRHDDDATSTGSNLALKFVDDFLLIGAQLDHRSPRGCCRPARAPDLMVASTLCGPPFSRSAISPFISHARISSRSTSTASRSPPATS